jgi:outer membrane immunogenic protein
MRILALIAVGLVCLVLPATAAGPLGGKAVSAPDLSLWNGPYAGFVTGLELASSTATSAVGCVDGAYLCDQGLHGGYQSNGALIGATASGKATSLSPGVGAVVGQNWRSGDWVGGIEGSLSLAPISLTNGASAPSINVGLLGTTFNVSETASANWLATFAGRVGHVVAPNVLLYGTAGLALTDLKVSNLYTDDLNQGGYGASTASALEAGFLIGAGADLAMSNGWLLRAEYLYVAFPSLKTSGGISIDDAVPNPFRSTADLSAQFVRAGLLRQF